MVLFLRLDPDGICPHLLQCLQRHVQETEHGHGIITQLLQQRIIRHLVRAFSLSQQVATSIML